MDEKKFVTFINLLRSLGVRISTAEAVDAITALKHVNIMDKNTVRVALKGMLIKDEEKIPVFDSAFETFFVTPEERLKQQMSYDDKKAEQEQLVAEAENDLNFRDYNLDLKDDDKRFYSSLEEERKQKIQEFLKKSSEAAHHNPAKFKSVLENLVKQHLNYWKRKTDYKIPMPLEKTGEYEIDAVLAELSTLDSEGKKLLYKDMQSISEEDLPAAKKIIKMLAKKLASKISRRYKSSRKKSQIDFKRTIRKNISYGGTPLKLQYRSRRIKKPQLLILCDVSGSMNRYSSFVTSFIYSLWEVLSKINTFIFSDDIEKVNISSGDYEDTAFNIIENSSVWGEGTNLDKALKKLRKNHAGLLTGKTVFIIVSDTKTLAVEEAAKTLKKIRSNVKEVVFLNTMPKEEWEGKHMVQALKKHSLMYPCHTISDLKNISAVWDLVV
jgi:hypothetical protein